MERQSKCLAPELECSYSAAAHGDTRSQLTSIGTLLAFVIVSGGVWILRVRRPDLPRAFKTPLVPVVPILGMGIPLLLMLSLPGSTWLRLIVWLILGMVLYFGYGRTHSKLARQRGDTR